MKETMNSGEVLEWETQRSLWDLSFTLRQTSLSTPMFSFLQIFLGCLNCKVFGCVYSTTDQQPFSDLYQCSKKRVNHGTKGSVHCSSFTFIWLVIVHTLFSTVFLCLLVCFLVETVIDLEDMRMPLQITADLISEYLGSS